MSREVELLTEIRDLLLVLAEPALAKRDYKFRDALRKIVGKSEKSRTAVLLMNGTLSQAAIVKQVPIDQGQLSRLVKALAKETLIAPDEKHPKLVVAISAAVFEEENGKSE
jgi:hypothetical protein